jgi:SAM-dependent methyltransferase
VQFDIGDAATLPFENETFDAVMSSQVFEYLDRTGEALSEIFRVLKPGGLVLIHDTDWGALLWHSSDAERMSRILQVWDGHLADPSLPQSLGSRLKAAGFAEVGAEPYIQLETELERGSVSDILMQFIVGYVESQGVPAADAIAWKEDLEKLGTAGAYFFNSNEYIFTGRKPA